MEPDEYLPETDDSPDDRAWKKAMRTINLRTGFLAHGKMFSKVDVGEIPLIHPRCPNLIESKVRKWRMANRTEDGRYPMLPTDIEWLKWKFGCNKIAGKNTRHPGFGLCKQCEKMWREGHGMTDEQLNQLAEDHEVALQQHSPVTYYAPDKSIVHLQEEERAEERKLQLYDEIADVSGLCSKVLNALNKKDDGGKPLQMYVKGDLVDIDDKTAIELANKLLNSSGKLKEMSDRINTRNAVPIEKVNLYFSRVAQICMKYVPEGERPNMMAELREIPAPK